MPDPYWHRGPPWGEGRPDWGPPGRQIFGRLIGFFILLVFLGPLLGMAGAFVFGFVRGPHRWLLLGLAILFLLGIALLARRRFGRTWAPIGELIDATRRLGDGETGVRIPIRGPGPFAAVNGSFNRMAARLEEEDERRRRLLADLSHELRTPLTVIRGEIEAVLDGVHDSSSLSNVVDEVDLLERLLEDLRVLTLAEAGRLQLHREQIEVGALVEDVVASFAAVAEGQGVGLMVDVSADAGTVDADPYRLRQVLANLISNSLHQMPAGGTLTLTAGGDGDRVVVEVADTGPGIPPDRLGQVFERFVKAGDSEGTGLGLSIARDLVEAHGGTINAADRPGGGALFTITLPVS